MLIILPSKMLDNDIRENNVKTVLKLKHFVSFIQTFQQVPRDWFHKNFYCKVQSNKVGKHSNFLFQILTDHNTNKVVAVTSVCCNN